jgi:hypothetical protein
MNCFKALFKYSPGHSEQNYEFFSRCRRILNTEFFYEGLIKNSSLLGRDAASFVKCFLTFQRNASSSYARTLWV